MKYLRSIVLSSLIVAVGILSFSIYAIEKERRSLKEDLIELSNVKYGLFSVDEWRKVLAAIISKKVQELNFTGDNRVAMRKKISELLYKVIDDFEVQFRRENSKSIKGFFKGIVTDFVGGFGSIRSKVPHFTEQIMDFLNDPANKKAIRAYIITKLDEYADNTFSKIDYSVHDTILMQRGYNSREEAIAGMSQAIATLNSQSAPYKIAVLIFALGLVVYLFVAKSFTKFEYAILISVSLLLLLTGLMLPMIEIDARIERMSFTLIGETVTFNDQVLYYKSKSILEVVWLMFRQSRVDVLVVGVLVFVFSVLFPVMKQFASLIFVFSAALKSNKLIRFLVFKTGKWSMADVMVIAIFMSYIGFSGIISEQLKQIEAITTSIEILTTNKSSLLTGFFFFTAFAVFSLAISQKIENQNS